MLTIALDFLTALELAPEDLVRQARANGCSVCGILVQPYPGLPFPDPGLIGNPRACAQLSRVAKDQHVRFDVAEVFMMEAHTAVDSFRPGLEVAARLGAGAVNTLALDSDPVRLAGNYTRLLELAGSFGLKVMAEVHKITPLGSITAAVDFFDRHDLDISIELDALHFFRYGGKVDEIARHSHRIGRAQLCDGAAVVTDADYMTEAVYRRNVPGWGELDLLEFMTALPDDIVVGVEVPRPDLRTQERIRRSIHATRDLAAVAGRVLA